MPERSLCSPLLGTLPYHRSAAQQERNFAHTVLKQTEALSCVACLYTAPEPSQRIAKEVAAESKEARAAADKEAEAALEAAVPDASIPDVHPDAVFVGSEHAKPAPGAVKEGVIDAVQSSKEAASTAKSSTDSKPEAKAAADQQQVSTTGSIQSSKQKAVSGPQGITPVDVKAKEAPSNTAADTQSADQSPAVQKQSSGKKQSPKRSKQQQAETTSVNENTPLLAQSTSSQPTDAAKNKTVEQPQAATNGAMSDPAAQGRDVENQADGAQPADTTTAEVSCKHDVVSALAHGHHECRVHTGA